MGRFIFAIKTFIRILRDAKFSGMVSHLNDRAFVENVELIADRDFSAKVKRLREGAYCEPAQLLGLFQREGRFVDFLMEEISGFPDAQIGAVARTVHQGCKKALQEYITLEPVMKEKEGESVTVPEGFDPSAIRLAGKVDGKPPFMGALAHHGWKISSTKIPSLPESFDPSVVVPAEVEIS